MTPKLAIYSTAVLTIFVLAILVIAFLNPVPLSSFYPGVRFANISGFIALFLVAASGILMLFRKPMLRMTRSPEALREVHVVLAGLGGLFIIFHVAFLLFFPMTLPVFFGYLGTYVAFVVWVTGVIFVEGFRSSLFYHGLLSLVGLSLIVIHVFGAGRDVPIFVSGVVLIGIAAVVLFGALSSSRNYRRGALGFRAEKLNNLPGDERGVSGASAPDLPLFRYRAYSPFIGLVMGPALFALWLVWVVPLGGLSSHPAELPTAIVILIFSGALVGLSVLSLSRRVWGMSFFSEEFGVRGRNLTRTFSYSKVKDVHRFRVFSGFQNRDIISIEVDGGISFTISGNPRNNVLNIDLYNWLLTKVPKNAIPEHRPEVS